MEVVQQAPWCFVTPRHGPMRVPGVIYATRVLLPPAAGDQALDQVVNVAALPGIVEAPEVANATPAPQPAPEKGGGYTLSEHVKRYYKTAST